MYSPSISPQGSRSPCEADQQELKGFKAELDRLRIAEQQNKQQLSLVSPEEDNIKQAQAYLQDARRTSLLTDVFDAPLFRSSAIRLLRLDNETGEVQTAATLNAPTTIRSRLVLSALLAGAALGTFMLSVRDAARQKSVIRRFQKELSDDNLTVTSILQTNRKP